jgi:hypothetical protein
VALGLPPVHKADDSNDVTSLQVLEATWKGGGGGAGEKGSEPREMPCPALFTSKPTHCVSDAWQSLESIVHPKHVFRGVCNSPHLQGKRSGLSPQQGARGYSRCQTWNTAFCPQAVHTEDYQVLRARCWLCLQPRLMQWEGLPPPAWGGEFTQTPSHPFAVITHCRVTWDG